MIIRSSRIEGELKTDEYEFATLEIEEAASLRGILKTLNGDEAEYSDLIVVDRGERIDLSKETLVIYNPLAFDINDKKLLTALYKKLEAEINSDAEYVTKLQTELSESAKKLDNLINNRSYDLCIDPNIATKEILKFFNVRLEANNLSGGLCNFLQANADLKLFRLIVFSNAKNYMTEEELEEVAKVISSTGTAVIFLENKRSRKALRNERKLYLDSDGHEAIQ